MQEAVDKCKDISIHSTARVETFVPWYPPILQPYFNPLHREGGDNGFIKKPPGTHWISIHSTARVETANGTKHECHYGDFNPLHREGGDCMNC